MREPPGETPTASGPAWARWRVRAGYPLAGVYAWLAAPTPLWLAVGALIALFGLAVRAAAAGHLRKHQALATSGPYAFTRNPLYVGSAVLAAGFLVAGRSWIAAAMVAVYFAMFYRAAMVGEEQELRMRYAAAFEEYAARVPLFWPRLKPAAPSGAEFSWELYRRNREYQAALGAALGFGFLVAKMLWRG